MICRTCGSCPLCHQTRLCGKRFQSTPMKLGGFWSFSIQCSTDHRFERIFRAISKSATTDHSFCRFHQSLKDMFGNIIPIAPVFRSVHSGFYCVG